MAHKFVNEIQAGEYFDDVFMVTQPVLRTTTRGDFYIAMFLSDKTGKLNGRMWQASEEMYKSLPKEGFVKIKAKSEVYQGAMQVVINDVQVVDASNVNLEDYLPRTKHSIKDMFNELTEILSSVKNSQLRSIVKEYLSDTDLMKNFCKAPAATSVHHNYLGGLLEHTLNMLKVASKVLPLYPEVQSDMVLTGIFLHDMGKTEELTYQMAFAYSDGGQLVGHITKSAIMLEKKVAKMAQDGTDIDRRIVDALTHIILAHHGQYEFGSPKLPATAEAFMVGYIDNLDAKMNQIGNLIENDNNNDNWTPWQNTLSTRIYKERLVDVQ